MKTAKPFNHQDTQAPSKEFKTNGLKQSFLFKNFIRFPWCLGVLVVLLAFVFLGCGRKEEPSGDPESIFTIKNGTISIDLKSPMMKYLEISTVPSTDEKNQDLKVVGQIIALANDSDQLRGSRISWVELDADFNKSLGFHSDSRLNAKVGDAFGLVSLPAEYNQQLKANEPVDILRYGLLASHTQAKVISIRSNKAQGSVDLGEPIQVVFKIKNGQDWYPGTNCVVSFPMLGAKPLLIPATALLHEGQQEYLLQEVVKGQYRPIPVYVLDTINDTVLVIGNIKPGQAIVSRGSILLKPILHKLLRIQMSNVVMTEKEQE